MRTLLSLSTCLLLCVPAVNAQSLLGTRGLGTPISPVDARARSLGGIGVGMFGPTHSLLDVAAPAGAVRRGVVAAMQPVSRSIDYDGASDAVASTRFPLLHVSYPMMGWVPFVGVGGYLDQSWAITSTGTETIGEDQYRVTDLAEARGGIAQVRVGVAYPLLPSLAVGGAVGRYTGAVERIVRRTFPDVPPGEMAGFESSNSWSYGAPLAAVGLRWDPARELRVAGSVTWSGRLEAQGEAAEAADFSVALPLEVAAGATGVLSPELSASAGVRWSGWSAANADLEGGAVDSWQVGGGLEWLGASLADRIVPIRVGGSFARLPFPFKGATPSEWSVGLGAGLRLAGDEVGPLAALDASLERGGTSAAADPSIQERFWRFTISLNLFGR